MFKMKFEDSSMNEQNFADAKNGDIQRYVAMSGVDVQSTHLPPAMPLESFSRPEQHGFGSFRVTQAGLNAFRSHLKHG